MLLNILVGTANAAGTAAPATPQSGISSMLIMLGVFFVFSYFMLWRPQSQRAKQQREMLSALAQDDEVVTSGGIIGRIKKISDQFIVVAVNETTNFVVQRNAIAAVLPKGTMKSIDA